MEQTSKSNYVGAPAIFLLEQACQHVNSAFGDYGCFLVGSCTERPDWRDVDIRFVMDDEHFKELFPGAYVNSALWEHDPRWLLINCSVAGWMRQMTGLPVDFQIQPQTFANERHDKPRQAIGMRIAKRPTNG